MIDHSEEVFVHRIKEVKYIESNYGTLRDSCVAYSEQMEQFAYMEAQLDAMLRDYGYEIRQTAEGYRAVRRNG